VTNQAYQRRRGEPSSALRHKAAASVNDLGVTLLGFEQGQFCTRSLPSLKCSPVELPFAIEAQHVVRKPNDSGGHSALNLNDSLDHAYALFSEEWNAIASWIIKHARELRARQPVKGVFRSKNKRAS